MTYSELSNYLLKISTYSREYVISDAGSSTLLLGTHCPAKCISSLLPVILKILICDFRFV